MGAITSSNENGSVEDPSMKKIHTHYVFLIHGWLGNSSEMSYLESAINRAANDFPSSTASTQTNVNSRIVTHCAKVNNWRTTDGIASGGTRLAHEIQQFILDDIQKNNHDNDNTSTSNESSDSGSGEHHVSISFVGNSLGGLYARYALSQLPMQLNVQETKITIHRMLFVTTATPHLGVAGRGHTFLPIPRLAEQVIGRALQTTGKDLFRIDNDDLIYKMSTDIEFLQPLSLFQKRVAYINAFRTDFQVPTRTAAFLSKNSTYPHYIHENEEDLPFLVAIASTKANHDILRGVEDEDELPCKKHTMSVKLDALGWEKVFVDMRDYIPRGIKLPSFLRKCSREKWKDFMKSKESNGEQSNIVESRELDAFMTGSDRIHIPVGHDVMVANARSESYSSFTVKGRPVMDYLASGVVKDLDLFV